MVRDARKRTDRKSEENEREKESDKERQPVPMVAEKVGCVHESLLITTHYKRTYAMSPSFSSKSDGGLAKTNCCSWDSCNSGTAHRNKS